MKNECTECSARKFKKRTKLWWYSLKCIKMWFAYYNWWYMNIAVHMKTAHVYPSERETQRETWHVFIIWASKCFCLSQNRWRDSSALHPSWDHLTSIKHTLHHAPLLLSEEISAIMAFSQCFLSNTDVKTCLIYLYEIVFLRNLVTLYIK